MRVAPLAAAAAIALAGCQAPDVGQACTLSVKNLPASPAADWFETGNTSCVNLTCIASPLPAGDTKVKHDPYCSKPCVSNRDCFESETGLVCRQVVLDPEFVASLDALAPSQCGNPPAGTTCRQKYLGDIQFSNFCAAPLP